MGEEFSSYRFNTLTRVGDDDCRKGICTSGISYSYACDALECGTNESYKILKIATAYPFPEKLALEFLEGLDEVLCIEELDPVLEKELTYIFTRINQMEY